MGLTCLVNYTAAATAAKSLQSYSTLCDPIDGSPPGSPVPAILQARTLEWVAISFSNAWKRKVKVKSFSRVRLFETPWTAAHQASLPMGFSMQEYWNGLPCPPAGDLLDPGIKPMSLISPALADRFFTTSTTWEAPHYIWHLCKWTFYTNALAHGHTPIMILCHRLSPSQSL